MTHTARPLHVSWEDRWTRNEAFAPGDLRARCYTGVGRKVLCVDVWPQGARQRPHERRQTGAGQNAARASANG